MQDRGVGVHSRGGEGYVDDASCASGASTPESGANVEDDLVDLRRQRQVKECGTQSAGRLGVVGRRAGAERKLVEAESAATEFVIGVEEGIHCYLDGCAAGQTLQDAVVDQVAGHRRAAARTSGSRRSAIGSVAMIQSMVTARDEHASGEASPAGAYCRVRTVVATA
jgi:hypothetical protein